MEEKTENWWCLQTPVLRGLETISSLLQLLQIGFESFSKTIEPLRSGVKTLSFPLRDKFFHFLPEPLRSGGETLFQLFLVGFDHLLFQVGILSEDMRPPFRNTLLCELFVAQPLRFVKGSVVFFN